MTERSATQSEEIDAACTAIFTIFLSSADGVHRRFDAILCKSFRMSCTEDFPSFDTESRAATNACNSMC